MKYNENVLIPENEVLQPESKTEPADPAQKMAGINPAGINEEDKKTNLTNNNFQNDSINNAYNHEYNQNTENFSQNSSQMYYNPGMQNFIPNQNFQQPSFSGQYGYGINQGYAFQGNAALNQMPYGPAQQNKAKNINYDKVPRPSVKDMKITSGKCSALILANTLMAYGVMLTIMSFGFETSETFSSIIPCIVTELIVIMLAKYMLPYGIKNEDFYYSPKPEGKSNITFIINACLAVFGTMLISTVITVLLTTLIAVSGIDLPDIGVPEETYRSLGDILMNNFYACLIAPVIEEIIFRGYILNNLRRFGNVPAIILSSVLFALFHGNLYQFANPILAGMLFSFIVIRTNSIVPSIIAHMFNNTTALVMSLCTSAFGNSTGTVITLVIYAIGVGALIMFLINYKTEIKMACAGSEDMEIKAETGIKNLFFNKGFIVFAVIYVIKLAGSFFMVN